MVRNIITILMRRDGMSYDEAERYVREVQEEISNEILAGASLEEIEDIIMDELGLEPDYVIDFLDV